MKRRRAMTAEEIEAFLLEGGAVQISDEEMKTGSFREEHRSFLRILASDDSRIPVPHEEELLDAGPNPSRSEKAKLRKSGVLI
jgi:hypothetical protein